MKLPRFTGLAERISPLFKELIWVLSWNHSCLLWVLPGLVNPRYLTLSSQNWAFLGWSFFLWYGIVEPMKVLSVDFASGFVLQILGRRVISQGFPQRVWLRLSGRDRFWCFGRPFAWSQSWVRIHLLAQWSLWDIHQRRLVISSHSDESRYTNSLPVSGPKSQSILLQSMQEKRKRPLSILHTFSSWKASLRCMIQGSLNFWTWRSDLLRFVEIQL